MNELGFSAHLRDILQIWESNADRWPSLSSPWRPSVEDIGLYNSLSNPRLRGSVLILGSTPELRDLAALGGSSFRVVADISLAMLQKGTELMRHGTSEYEIWIKGDWTQIPLQEESFDLIVGDLIWWVLSIEQQEKVLDTICRLLKEDGYFVSRFRFQSVNSSSLSLDALVHQYLPLLSDNKEIRISKRNEMLSFLYDATMNQTHKTIDRGRVKTQLLRYIDSHPTIQPHERAFIVEASQNIVGADWTVQNREEILAALDTKLKLITSVSAGDYNASHYPVLKFVKR